MPDVQATPRRSTRFQPLYQASKSSGVIDFEDRWNEEEPIHIRQAIPNVDILRHDEPVPSDTELRFFSGFTRYPKQRNSRKLKNQTETRYTVGDTVLVATGIATSVGVIIAMWEAIAPVHSSEEEEEDLNTPAPDRKIRIRWFLRKEELPKHRKKRDEKLNELYLTLDGAAALPLDAIKSHCEVDRQYARSSDGVEAANAGNFFCRHAVNAQRAIFYDFDWTTHRAAALRDSEWDDFQAWNVQIQEVKPNKRSKKIQDAPRRKRVDASADSGHEESDSEDDDGSLSGEDDFVARENGPPDSDDEEGDEEDDDDEVDEVDESDDDNDNDMDTGFGTPKKRRRNGTHGSPSKRSRSTHTPSRRSKQSRAQPTPHSKAALRKRNRSKNPGVYKKLVFNIEAGDDAEVKALPPDPWLRAMHTLHIANRPRGAALPCREQEFEQIVSGLQGILEEGTGGCIYVSGVPGTGKTATVHAVVRQLKRMAEENETVPFTYVEINGLKLTDPAAAYSLLWESLLGEVEGGAAAASRKSKSHKEALKSLTSYFSGKGRGPSEHACVVLMDELDQLMTTNQDVIYNFFNWPMLVSSRLVVLAVANTMDLPERVMTGRVRSRLGMVRINFQPYKTAQLQQIVQARLDAAKDSFEESHEGREKVVLTEDAVKLAAMKTSSVSGDARRVLDVCRRAIELVRPEEKTATGGNVMYIITSVQSSPAFTLVRSCTFHQRVMLAAILKCIKKTGIETVKWDEVQDQHIAYASILSTSRGRDKVTANELLIVLNSLVSSRAIIIEKDKNVTKDMGARKLVLNVDTTDIERVLADEGGVRWANLL